jgi:hypothetical protein
MKIIFLDIDGVLNSEQTCFEYHEATGKPGYGGWFKQEEVCTKENVLWGEVLLLNLHKIVNATGASIVISSTWRKYFTVDKFKEMFALYGWDNAPIVGKTPVSINRFRGKEIKEWIDLNEVEKFVILDDDTDFMDDQQPFFVNTNGMYGLSGDDAEKAISILNN